MKGDILKYTMMLTKCLAFCIISFIITCFMYTITILWFFWI